jgi:hypothetical protein
MELGNLKVEVAPFGPRYVKKGLDLLKITVLI